MSEPWETRREAGGVMLWRILNLLNEWLVLKLVSRRELGKDFDQGSEYLKSEVGKLLPVGHIQPAGLFYENMAMPHACMYCLWLPSGYMGGLSSCDRDTWPYGPKVLAIYYLTFHRKSLPAPDINIIHLFSHSFIDSYIE